MPKLYQIPILATNPTRTLLHISRTAAQFAAQSSTGIETNLFFACGQTRPRFSADSRPEGGIFRTLPEFLLNAHKQKGSLFPDPLSAIAFLWLVLFYHLDFEEPERIIDRREPLQRKRGIAGDDIFRRIHLKKLPIRVREFGLAVNLVF